MGAVNPGFCRDFGHFLPVKQAVLFPRFLKDARRGVAPAPHACFWVFHLDPTQGRHVPVEGVVGVKGHQVMAAACPSQEGLKVAVGFDAFEV